MSEVLEQSGRDRPVDPSAGPARWRQTWHRLCFLHWPVPVNVLRLSVPMALDIDTHDGTAWLAVTPFWMSGIIHSSVRLPLVPGFAELNVRTYVRHRDGPGVWFFSLDAGSYLAVLAARTLFHLNYVHAQMKVELRGEDAITYFSQRSDGTTFAADYRPVGEPVRSTPGSLEAFLTERYRLYAWSKGQLYRSEIDHVPWPLQKAEADVGRNDLPAVNGVQVEGKPVAHYARRLDVSIWPLVKVAP